MKFGSSFDKTWSSANGSKDNEFKKDVILDEVARLIEFDRPAVIDSLRDSGYSIGSGASKKKVIDATVNQIYSSKQFRSDIAKKISAPKTLNAEGAASGAGSSLNPVGAVAGAVGQSLEAIFGFGKARQEYKSEQERTRQQMYDKLLADNERKNWIPVIVIGGVLLIGGLVAYFTLRNKK